MGGLALAIRVAILDRWPDVVAHPSVWKVGRFADAFAHRWYDRPLPGPTQAWVDRCTSVSQHQLLRSARKRRYTRYCEQMTERRLANPSDVALVNIGPGRRSKNSLYVAAAVDVSLAGTPASALPWNFEGEPASPFGRAATATTIREAQRIVEAWGPGSKGVVSLRDPNHPSRRYFNAVNLYGRASFSDYSAPDDTRTPAARAEAHLASIDERFGFPSILLWRLADLGAQAPIPDHFFELPRQAAEALLDSLWGPNLPDVARQAARDHVWFNGDLTHTRWLTRAIQRGACTLLPDYLTRLATGELAVDHDTPAALTQLDSVVLELLAIGQPRMHNGTVEITVADTCRVRDLLACVPDIVVRHSPVDGLPDGSIELCLDHRCRERLREDDPTYQPPFAAADEPQGAHRLRTSAPRTYSWQDTNRAAGPGSRKTNCWNTAAATASYLASGAPSSSLPIYRHAPLRPTIPEFLTMIGAIGDTHFVASKADADAVVRSWGPLGQGIVAAAHSAMSTHMFNAYCEADGITVRYLDGHTSEEGDFNFDVSWMRIGIVRLTARCYNPHHTSARHAVASS